jgi:APA family basic amino acid/polyamine antiporter
MPTAAEPHKLHRILGVAFGVAVTVGGTIGVGILRRPGAVAAQLGNTWLILAMWIFGGFFALASTLVVAELGAMFPEAGGFYVFARRTFGESTGFAVGWSDWLGQNTAVAYQALTIGELSVVLMPALAGKATAIAVVAILVFLALHWIGLRAGSSTQQITSLALTIAYLFLIVACFLAKGSGTFAGAQTLPDPATSGGWFVAVMLALASVIASYDGWYQAIYFTEENSDPGRSLPRSLIIGVLLVIAVYLLINLAFLRVLPLARLAASGLPAADAAQVVFGGSGATIITWISLISMPAAINATLLSSARIAFAVSRDSFGWRKGIEVNRGGTPTMATLLSAGAALLLVLSGSFEKLIALASFFFVATYFSAYAAIFVLRRREPETARPFRAWGYPWTALFVLAVGFVFLAGTVISDPSDALPAAGLVALSYPVYWVIRKQRLL